MRIPRWTQLSEFPKSDGNWSAWYPLLFMRIDGEARVRRHLKTANPNVPILLSSPTSGGHYVPPIIVDTGAVTSKLARDGRLMFYMLIAFTVFGSIAFYLGADLRGAAGFFLIFLTLCIYYGFNHYLNQNETSAIVERWQFHGWCFATQPLYGWGFLIFMVSLGLAQIFLSKVFGSDEAVKLAFGLVYATQAGSGEWWRFLTGPLLHNGLAHWMINTLIGSGLLLIYGPVQGVRLIAAMLFSAAASFLGVYAFYLLVPIDGDGIVGISGAISGAIGYFLAANFRYANMFPRYYYVVTIFVALSTSLLVSMVVSLASFITHLSGLIAGLTLGYVTRPVASSFYLADDVA